MKKLTRFFLILTFALGLQTSLYSQLSDMEILQSGPEDAQAILQEYLTPYANIFGSDLNSGWYNSAKPHKFGGFDVTVTFNTGWAPKSALTFDASKLKLSEGNYLVGNPISPTIAGSNSSGTPKVNYYESFGSDSVLVASYNLPKGSGVNIIPLPMAQLTIGLPWGTDVSVRFLPSIPIGNSGQVGLWGVGGRHSILQHIPALKRLPFLDITAQGGYTKLNSFVNLDYDVSDLGSFVIDLTNNTNQFANQKIEMTSSSWNINLIVSETLPIISFYQGIGYSSSSVDVGVLGNYPFPRLETSGANAGNVVVTDDDVLADPIQFEIQNNKDLRLNAGFRLKLGVLTFHFDYTKAKYSVVTGGIGISFR
jgi:hypothetical protein